MRRARTQGARGRPPDAAKRAAIARAASRLFLERGFAGTSIEAVARRAGVSKPTVYAHFGDKDGLFQTIVRERCESYAPPESPDGLLALPPREALRRLGHSFVSLLFDPEVLRLHRVLVGEADRHPKMSELFFEAGPERVSGALAGLLRRGSERGDYRIDDPVIAAQHFHALLRGMLHFRATLNLRPRASAAEIEEHVERCVDVFLRAHGAPRGRRLRGGSRSARRDGGRRPRPRGRGRSSP
jgi:TetR/AcrR family transcriptional repressor of mexJK operon